MRIAIVINASWNIYNFRMGLVRALLADGHEVYAIAPPDAYSVKLQEAGCRYLPVRLDQKGSHPLKDVAFAWALHRLYRQVRPDVVLHFTIKPNIYGSLAAGLLKIPAINNVSGLGTVFLRNNQTSKIARALYRLAFRSPRKVFFQNPDDRTLFLRLKLVKPAITDLLPGSGINLQQFTPCPFRRNHPFTFLLIARLLYDKGIVEFVEAVKLLKAEGVPARFQLLGFVDKSPLGIPELLLQTWVAEQLIEYVGTTDDVKPFIHAADCVVLPSYREGTPRTLLEAASLAKPLIATNVPGCTEIVEHEVNGLLCRVRNAADLAVQMRKMLHLNDNQLHAMGQASRRKVEQQFDEKIVIEKYLQTINFL